MSNQWHTSAARRLPSASMPAAVEMIDGGGEPLRQGRVAVVVQSRLRLGPGEHLARRRTSRSPDVSAQPHQFVLGFADVLRRRGGVLQSGHGAVVEDLRHPQAGVDVAP